MSIWLKIGAIAMPLLVAMEADYTSYKSAKDKDPKVKFDWPLALLKWAKGALASAGVSVAVIDG